MISQTIFMSSDDLLFFVIRAPIVPVRIVSGIARGRTLFTPPPNERAIRPTSDKAREALFSILGRVVDGAKVLDLFAGTGALGLEAFSRGAASVVFVDVDRKARELIRRNISRLFSDFPIAKNFRWSLKTSAEISGRTTFGDSPRRLRSDLCRPALWPGPFTGHPCHSR
jgi:16S rRNA (guanine(966)-N(2))-methyltransferase RsmD